MTFIKLYFIVIPPYPECIFGQTDIAAYLWQSGRFRQKYQSDPDIPDQDIQDFQLRCSG
jgi:hypothetical protein